MARVHYYLSDARAGAYAQVRLRFVCGNAVAFRCGTNISVPVAMWSQAMERAIISTKASGADQRKASEANQQLESLRLFIFEEYTRTNEHTSEWLRNVVERFHSPADTKQRLGDLCMQYASISELSSGTVKHYAALDALLSKYENANGALYAESVTVQDLERLRMWFMRDHVSNTVVGFFKKIRATMAWAERTGRIQNTPFRRFDIGTEHYAAPISLTREERDRIAVADIPVKWLAVQRDIFIFQCHIGCRVSDLIALTQENIENGCVQYVPIKTAGTKMDAVIVPLSRTAKAIIERYKDENRKALLPFISSPAYNDAIRAVLHMVGIDRTVRVSGKAPAPLWKVASSHIARKTFADILFEVTQSDTIVASLTGHAEGSKALKHYRRVHLDTQRKAIEGME